MTPDEARQIADDLRMAFDCPVFILYPGEEILGGNEKEVTIYSKETNSLIVHPI